MQKEDLVKRLKIFAAVVTTAFVVLIVGLVIQFGFIAHQNTELARLKAGNEAKRQEIIEIEREVEYIKGELVNDWQQTHEQL